MKSLLSHGQCKLPLVSAVGAILIVAIQARPDLVSSLYGRGYALIPAPQQVKLEGDDFRLTPAWSLDLGKAVSPDSPAVETLKSGFEGRHGFKLAERGNGAAIHLEIQPNSVPVGEVQDRDKQALAEQAYKLSLSKGGITITANAPAGLFYGVETLVQLARSGSEGWTLPQGEIVDWPDVQYREIFWDEQFHLDQLDVIKQAIRRAAFFKINAFTLRLNEHFQYASAPALVDPYALSPAEVQELTDYALRYYVQLVPYLDGPAHVNFILQRDEYAKLREFPEEAFQMCSTNPDTYKLLEGMFQDLINANRGGKYFHLSTDEAWFIGLADNEQCHEAQRARELGSPSKVWVEYTNKTANFLRDHGRQVIFWGENPMLAEDIPLLPSWLINGEVFSPEYNQAFRAHGIRQIIYTNTLPDDPLFPFYYALSPHDQVYAEGEMPERAAQAFNEISYTLARRQADIMGAGIYAWADNGPHSETYWLGYAVGASAAWHPGSPDPQELNHSFYDLFYGQGATDIGRLYQLMSTQAQFFAGSWDSEPSGPVMFGESYGIGPYTPHHATLPLPSVPAGDYLHLKNEWLPDNARRLELAWKSLGGNDELRNLLYKNLPRVESNRYNLEVYFSIANLFRQNLLMLIHLGEINKALETSQNHAAKLQYADAVDALDQTLDTAGRIRDERNQALHDATTTWYKTWFPRVREANGRRVARAPQDFVDTQPTERARRQQEGLLYLLDREFALPFGQWVNDVLEARNRYAAAHKLPAREMKFDWQDSETLHGQTVDRGL